MNICLYYLVGFIDFRLFYSNSYAPEDIEGGIKTESKPHLDLRTVLV